MLQNTLDNPVSLTYFHVADIEDIRKMLCFYLTDHDRYSARHHSALQTEKNKKNAKNIRVKCHFIRQCLFSKITALKLNLLKRK